MDKVRIWFVYAQLQLIILDVGRSCIVVTIGGRTVMFDCGMHMGFNDERRFPDFTTLSASGNFDRIIDAVIISHL